MTLGNKLTILLCLLFSFLLAGVFTVQNRFLLTRFEELEKSLAVQDIDRAVEAFTNEMHHLDTLVQDWATWDDTYTFMQDRNPEYEHSNLLPITFIQNNLQLIAFYNVKQQVYWIKYRGAGGEEAPPPSFFQFDCTALFKRLFPSPKPVSNVMGIVNTEQGPMIIAARPILTSENRGPSHGTLVFGRRLTDEWFGRLARQVRLDLRYKVADISGPLNDSSVMEALQNGTVFDDYHFEIDDESLKISRLLPDIIHQPVLKLTVQRNREVWNSGKTASRWSLFTIAGVGILLFLVLGAFIRYQIIIPLLQMRRHAAGIRSGGNLEARLNWIRFDEIGDLADSFDYMVSSIESLHDGLESRILERTGELRSANQKLRHEVSERLAAEAKLRQSKESVEAINATNIRFLGAITHELRTPLNGIIGMIHLLDARVSDPEGRACIVSLRSCADLLLNVVNDILDFSNTESAPPVVEFLPFDLRLLMEDIIEKYRLRAEEKQLALELAIKTDVPTRLIGDPGRLKQIFSHLVANGIKFTSAARISVSVSLVAEEDRQVRLKFEVADTGIGIFSEQQIGVQQQTIPNDKSESLKNSGMGLGLTLCRRRILSMDGSLKIFEEKTSGTLAIVELPFIIQSYPVKSQPGLPKVTLQGVQVIVIEGSPAIRKSIEERLRSFGCAVRAEETAEAGFLRISDAITSDNAPDAVIVGTGIRDLSPAEVNERLAGGPALKQTVWILLADQGRRGDAAKAKSKGFHGFLPVMHAPELIRDCLYNLLNGRLVPDDPGGIITRYRIAEFRKEQIRILIVEDNPVNLLLQKKIVEKFGYPVEGVPGGKEALQLLARERFAVILMDIQMPEMDGVETTIRIRRKEAGEGCAGLPIIAITAHSSPEDRERCLAAGIDAYMGKPVKPDALMEKIERYARQFIEMDT